MGDNYIYLYAVNFSIELIICTGLLSIYLPRRKQFTIRLILSAFGYWGFFSLLYYLFTKIQETYFIISFSYYTLIFIASIFAIWAVFDIDWKKAIFFGTAGYSCQHFCFSFFNLFPILREVTLISNNTSIVMDYLVYILVAALFSFFLVRPIYKSNSQFRIDFRLGFLSLLVLIINIGLSNLTMGLNLSGDDVLLARRIISIFASITCCLCLFLQFGLTKENNLIEEKTTLEQLLHMEKQQHELSKENIEIINMKCHDLKNQMNTLLLTNNKEELESSVQEIKNSIQIYENTFNTGSDALDLILTEKSLICQKYNIKQSCILDGEKLAFMSSSDIYSLFGNIMDNAIESLSKEEDEEKRCLTLKIHAEKGVLAIHEDNYCKKELKFQNGLPVTTKGDLNYHGIGTRSIRYLVEKYKGTLQITQERERFNIDILFFL